MFKSAAIATAFLLAAALPAAADKGAAENCRVHAEGAAFNGSKFDYAERYNAAYATCMGEGTAQRYAQIDNRNPYKSSVIGQCPPGVSVMHRGTLYCQK